MPALFVFLLKVNAALLLFCAGYYLVLRHLTFYTLNRVYLMGAIVFATVYPQINLDAFFQRHQQLAQPVYIVVDNLHLSEQTLAQPAYWNWLEAVFFAGVVLLTGKLFTQLFSLYKVYRASQREEILGHDVRVVKGDGGPFSFWKSIYVNPTGYTDEDLRAILKHEQVHTDEWHTLDILLAELSVIFYWFNPGVWLMRKAVRENIEFITDRKILQQGADTKQYQYSLLNVSISNTKPGIANHFNISTLKKRILMMNAKRSSNINLTRYAFLVPVLLVMLLSFSITRAAIVKTSKLTYKALQTSVNRIVNDNPVTNKLAAIFEEPQKTPLVQKKDTIKIINVNKKDTVKLISSTVNFAPSLELRDSTKEVHIINLMLDTSEHKIKRVRINGRSYEPDADKKYFISVVDSNSKQMMRRDTVMLRLGHPVAANVQHPAIVFGGGATYRINSAASDSGRKAVELLKHLDDLSAKDNKAAKILAEKMLAANSLAKKDVEEITVRGYAMSQKVDKDHLGDMLIVIDGKEADKNDMQKLATSDIKIVVKKGGPELTKQYGEKAKNGVAFITTKKEK